MGIVLKVNGKMIYCMVKEKSILMMEKVFKDYFKKVQNMALGK